MRHAFALGQPVAHRAGPPGDRCLRSPLVQSAQSILGRFGPDSELRRWGLKLAATGGKRGKMRAVAAVARKLAVAPHAMWRNGERFQAFPQPAAKEAWRRGSGSRKGCPSTAEQPETTAVNSLQTGSTAAKARKGVFASQWQMPIHLVSG